MNRRDTQEHLHVKTHPMHKSLLTALFTIATACISITQAQGVIRGVIADGTTGETLIGANVIIREPYKGAMADLDGRYSLEGLAPGTYEVVGSFIGYVPVTEVVTVVGDETQIVNFNLNMETFVIEQAAEVVAKVDRSRDVYMENIRKKNAASIDYISSQQIRQTGDSDAASAMRRIPGVSTVGNFVFVRGLSDRYIKTTLNGAEIPSINPRRNTIEMDIFPTTLVDNLVVVKSSTSNLPGDWSGAYLNVVTKDFPDQFLFNYSTTLGFNTQTTFREIISSQRSSTDWLGFDDGLRGLPNAVDGVTASDWPTMDMPCFYEGLVHMGYAEQLDQMGINDCTDIGSGNPISAVVNQLGLSVDSLEQYGMVPLSISQNAGLSAIGQSFSKTWENTRRVAPLDMTHSLSFGNQTKLFGRDLGYIFGLQYKMNSRYYSGGDYARYNAGNLESSEGMQLLRQFADERSSETVYWNMLLNLSYKVNEFNKVSFMAMPNVTGQNSSRYLLGINPSDTDEMQEQRTQRYEQRRLNIYQLRGEHYLPASEGQVSWTASYSEGRMETPDMKVFYNNFSERITPIDSLASFTGADGSDLTAEALERINEMVSDGVLPGDWATNPEAAVAALANQGVIVDAWDVPLDVDTVYSINTALYPSPTRYFRELNESKLDVKVHYTRPLFEDRDWPSKFSAGLSYVRTELSHAENTFGMVQNGTFFNGNLTSFFDDANMTISRGGDFVSTVLLTDLVNSYRGTMNVSGAYALIDHTFSERFRVNAGMRIETTDMGIRSTKLDLVDDLTPQEAARLEGGLNEVDWMPSLNVTYALGEIDPIKITNLRFAYSRSIARPVFREKSPFRGFDFETLEVLKGNPLLDETKIDNFDLRIEHYPALGEVLSASIFYKRFTDPIEQTTVLEAVNTEYTWANVPYANVFGLEFEGRKNLGSISDALSPFTLSANVTFIRSRAVIFEEELNVIRNTDPMHPNTRPLFGQSPYIVNAMLNYRNDSLDFNASVAFNVQGEQLILATIGGLPDIYQQPTPALDVTLTKNFGDHFGLRLRARNLINPIDRKTYSFQGVSYDWLANTSGRNFALTLSYRI